MTWMGLLSTTLPGEDEPGRINIKKRRDGDRLNRRGVSL